MLYITGDTHNTIDMTNGSSATGTAITDMKIMRRINMSRCTGWGLWWRGDV